MHSRLKRQTLATLCMTVGALAVGALAAGGLSGCGGHVEEPAALPALPEAEQAEAAREKQQRLAVAAEQTSGMTSGDAIVAKTSAGKPAAPVDLKYELRGEPAKGKALPIDIALLPHAPAGFVRVTFIATEGLAIAQDQPAEFLSTQADLVYRHTLTVTPRDDGEYYLSAIVLMNLENGPEARSFTIPVPVGAAATRATVALKPDTRPRDASGQPLEIMKAEPPPPPR
jgi:hypothetical protein